MSTPVRVRVRMYQVGFGDCFLLSVEYDEPLPDGRAERHLLIDFGSSHPPRPGKARGRMADVAALVDEHTGGVLDVLVVTHRHRDHLRGFEVGAAAAVMKKLAPKLVLRSWTEDPALAPTADGPSGAGARAAGPASAAAGAAATRTAGAGSTAASRAADRAPAAGGVSPAAPAGGVSAASARYAALLARAQEHVARLSDVAGLDDDIRAAAEDQLKNAEAVALLEELSEDGRGRYLHAGMDLDLAEVVPGLETLVLGPPTVDQDPRVAKQRENDPEYWLTALDASLRAAGSAAEAGAPTPPSPPPGPVRWLVERLASERSHSAARLVRDLDDALNNTSLVLLLRVGGVTLLFPGDAQIENWRHTLDQLPRDAKLRARLARVDLYKVGHHGSRNATPRSLHALWKARPDDAPGLTALMSTCEGVHGERDNAVPQTNLVSALREVAELISTDDLDTEEYVELVSDAAHGPFVRVAAPGR
ncbi:hypothetical protein R8Z57_13700 [Microbacterium sp. M3]|uniref:MBL fold metallo-hydrolase n=3 Tax=Microbacterium arthrosphaerae TaxID=792652 RepID=A0ABU4H594_9MICO|nr:MULTISPECIES: hypothetical protein [Microbacterium]MDW4573830.1 hypothetical protein [Microbacterium arthrosphaerae]MDW7607685.1 hypothetical protein [Microbacterium sp. M3]